MSDSEKQQSTLMKKMLIQLWESFLKEIPFEQLSFKTQEMIDEFLRKFPEIELDNDIRNKKEVYLTIADFLHEKLNQPLHLCLSTAHILCEETDKRLLEDSGYDTRARLVEDAKRLILSMKVHFEILSNRRYTRITEIYFLTGSKPNVYQVKKELEWDRLPEDVRKLHLIEDAEKQTFKLYPKEL